ncbi:alpha/beta hydrolase [Actinocorallia lasiicapitis]
MKKLIVLTAVAGLGLSVLQPAAAQAKPKAASIKWQKCAEESGLPELKSYFPTLAKTKLECATIKVPLDYRKPHGKKIGIALTRLKHTGKGKARHMLVNPGGPGGTGTDYAVVAAARASDKFRSKIDVIGFDPRGTGGSTQISCQADFFNPVRADPNPTGKADIVAQLARSKAYAKACGKKYGQLLKHLKTIDNVHDMDQIRQRLGDKKLDFYGASYGTYLGGVYASVFPRKVGRFALDSMVDPKSVWYKGQIEQDYAFERNINFLFGWIAKHDAEFGLGKDKKTVSEQFYKVRSELKAKPVSVALDPKKPAELTKVGPSELDDTWLGAGYRASDIRWTDLARSLSQRVNKGDDTGIAQTFADYGATEEPTSGYAVYLGTQCTDVQWPKSWKKWEKDAKTVQATAPFMAWGNTWYNTPCLYWPAKAGKPVKVTKKRGLPTILTFQATLDAATPFPNALNMTKALGAKVVIEDKGLTHGIVQRGNAPIDAYFENFMLYGKLPKKNVTHVKALPEPKVVPVDPAARTIGGHVSDFLLK